MYAVPVPSPGTCLRRSLRPRLVALLAILGVALLPAILGAQPHAGANPPGPSSSAEATETADEQGGLAEAKRLFRAGNELRRAGDCARALELYLKSRALVPSVPNTWNAAVCLDRLRRPDEALELFETLLTDLRQELTRADYASVTKSVSRLRKQVGSINVMANVDGFLVIDGRARGSLPLVAPVRALPGSRKVRIMKDGYQTFETTVEVQAGKTTDLDARLEPLVTAGRLRIDAPGLGGADVYVDGAWVGQVPWEGQLAPGEHRFLVRRGDVGSAPRAVRVVEGQTVTAAAQPLPLGPEVRVLVTPHTAELRIGEVAVGHGRWQGRLPLGDHRIAAREEGYVAQERAVTIDADSHGDVTLRLPVDEDHPRWGVLGGQIWIEAFGGPAFAPSLGSDAEATCDTATCSADPIALGFVAGGRVGYEFPFRLSLEVAGGYLSLRKQLSRSVPSFYDVGSPPIRVPTRYELEDDIRLAGGLAVAGVGYRLPLGETFQLRGHALAGVFFGSASDAPTGSVHVDGSRAEVTLLGADEAVTFADLLILPELQLGARFDGLSVNVGLMVGIFALRGPSYPTAGLLVVRPDCDGSTANAGCVPGSAVVDAESAYGTFVALLPTASLAYAF